MINVFIVDDHQIFRDGLRMLIGTVEDIDCIGEAESGPEAIEKLNDVQPDLILMDVQMPGVNGIETTHRIKEKYPDIIVLMLTMFEDDQSVFAAMRAGAVGYVLKGINHEDMLGSIRIAAGGGAVFSPSIASHMMQWFTQLQTEKQPNLAGAFPELTQREMDVLALIAEGDDNSVIAKKLFLTSKTVRNYVSRVLKKLEVNDREEAIQKARKSGLDESND